MGDNLEISGTVILLRSFGRLKETLIQILRCANSSGKMSCDLLSDLGYVETKRGKEKREVLSKRKREGKKRGRFCLRDKERKRKNRQKKKKLGLREWKWEREKMVESKIQIKGDGVGCNKNTADGSVWWGKFWVLPQIAGVSSIPSGIEKPTSPHLFEALQLRSVTFPWKAHLSLGFCLHVVFIDVLCREAADDMSHPKLPVVRLPPYSNPRHQLHHSRHQCRFLFSSGTLLYSCLSVDSMTLFIVMGFSSICRSLVKMSGHDSPQLSILQCFN